MLFNDQSPLRLGREELESVAGVNFSPHIEISSLLRQSLVLGRIFHRQTQEL